MELEEFKGRYITYPDVIKERYKIDISGNVYDEENDKFLKPKIRGGRYGGYYVVSLRIRRYGKNMTKSIFLHRLVAHTFIENPNNYPMVNHIDGNKLNPHVTNLEWCTAKMNNDHALRTGLRGVGEKSPMATITNEQARNICELLQEGKSVKYITKELGIPHSIIRNIKSGVSWKSISKDYNLKTLHQDRIDEEMARKICEYLELGFKNKEIRELLGVTKKTILNIRDGNTWKSISCEYDFPRERSLLTKDKVIKICELLQEGKRTIDVANETGYPYHAIQKIKKRKTWHEITKNYNF